MTRFLLILITLLSACSAFSPALQVDTEPTLAELAAQRGRLIGVSVLAEPLRSDEKYRTLVAREFSLLTTENALKMDVVRPEVGREDFSAADSIVLFAEQQALEVRAHPLVWHRQLPKWLIYQQWQADELREILQSHIQQVVERYRGKVYAWDVINEAVTTSGTFRKSIWFNKLGASYIADSFRWAHQADPGAKLFYNDYDIGMPGKKLTAVHELLKGLLAEGVPVHGVGLQMHIRPKYQPSQGDIEYAIARFAELGLEVHISELDVAVAVPADDRALAAQAEYAAEVMQACLANPHCTSFGVWGVSDRYSWIPSHFKGLGEGAVFDTELRPKPSLFSLKAALRKKPPR